MEGRGHVFSTHGDTETIVHLYEEYGNALRGSPARHVCFALWDERKRRLFIARDRLGIKPLYYAEIGGRLLFASELKSILQLAEVERKLSWSAVSHLFTFLSTPPTEAIIEGCTSSSPGIF
jgi:asparagine synthase (glutamine-hydrolysing)